MSVKINFIDGNYLMIPKDELTQLQIQQILQWFESEGSPIISFTVGDITHNLPRHAIYNILYDI